MTRGLAIGPIGGVRIVLSIAWLLIVGIIVVAVGSVEGIFDEVIAAGLPPAARWVLGTVLGLLFLSSLALHDLVHALVARQVGVQVDTISLSVIGTQGQLEQTAASPRGEMAIAVSAPLASLVLGGLMVGASMAFTGASDWPMLAAANVFWLVGLSNVLLGAINLLPGAPFDGGRVVRALAWARTGDIVRGSHVAVLGGRMLAYGMLGAGVAVVVATDHFFEGLWLAVLGWMLNMSAKMGRRRLEVGEIAEGLSVSDVMDEGYAVIGPNLTVDTLLAQHEHSGDDVSVYPVTEQGTLLGAVDVRRLARMPGTQKESTRVGEVMTGIERLPRLTRMTTAIDALYSFERSRADALPVVDEQAGGTLVGMLTRENLIDALRTRRADRQARQPAR